MKSPANKYHVIINIGIALTAFALVAVLALRFGANARPDRSKKKGDDHTGPAVRLPLSNIDWEKNRRTVILVIADDCSYCHDSAGFYRILSDELRKTGNAELVVIFPSWSTAGEDYLKSIGLSGVEYRHEALNLLSVTGTPDLLLVDNRGAVTSRWSGKLGPNEARDLFDRLQLDSGLLKEDAGSHQPHSPVPVALIDPALLKRAIDEGGKVTVLDIRAREEFAQGHIPTSRNIPADELEVRSINELLPSDYIVLYCDSPGEDLSRFANLVLRQQRFERVSVLSGGLAGWRNSGWQLLVR